MSKLTLGRIAKLYGLHRSSLYEAVHKGRVSAGFNGKGQRVIDLAEMIRVYGEPSGSPTVPPDTSTPVLDSHPTHQTSPTQWAEVLTELRLLREEVIGLRAELRLIEHKPDKDVMMVQPSAEAGRRLEDAIASKPQSFADLLAGLGDS